MVNVLEVTSPSAVETATVYPYPNGFSKENMGIIGYQIGWTHLGETNYYVTNNGQAYMFTRNDGIVMSVCNGQPACLNVPVRIYYVDISK